ncbi:MAG: gliding motility-associated C-terminal domain-containing protein, partial [Flavobacteriaceae bacterium]|nr:gliding motility-associated C-terminal domain-containing protein [Flavobacteriaceae bacterium]
EVLNTCLGDSTQFNLTTNDTVTSASWDFGDGVTSTDFNPTHTYSNSGTYDVTLTISNDTETLTINESITIFDAPTANPVPDYILCDDANDQVELFDLTTRDQFILDTQSNTTFSINYFSSLIDAENNNNPLSTNYYNTNMEEEIFARIENSQNNQCYDITSFNIIVAALPTAYPVNDYIVCDDESNDGIATFNLTSINNQVLNGQSSTTFSTSFHTTYIDAIDGSNSLPNNYTNQSANEEVFIRVFNSDYPDCFNITSFNLIVSQQPVANTVTDFVMCENDMFDLDLSLFDQDVLLNQNSSDFSVSYYYNQNDAINSLNEINTEISYDEDMIVFAKVENNNNLDCYAITPIKLTIYRFPFEPFEEIESCFQRNFTLEANIESDEATYLWNTGETAESITVNNFGTYEVEITINNCTEVKTIDFKQDKDCNIPQGISPNGDIFNESLDLSFLDIDNLIIYNRYGTEVYSKNNYINEWKGQTNDGKKLPTGTYFYVIKTLSNKTHTGWVYLNR